jgi:hypothetical protein
MRNIHMEENFVQYRYSEAPQSNSYSIACHLVSFLVWRYISARVPSGLGCGGRQSPERPGMILATCSHQRPGLVHIGKGPVSCTHHIPLALD